MASTLASSSTSAPSPAPAAASRSSDGLQYTYQPAPGAPESLVQKTRAALYSLFPHPKTRSAGTTPKMSEPDSSSAPASSHKHTHDPVDATGTSGSAAHTLDSQVGGHAGVLSSEDGALVIKPTLHLEKQFYDELAASSPLAVEIASIGESHVPALSPFEALRPWVPKYYGTLKLEGRAKTSGESGETIVEDIPEVKNKDEY